MKKAIIYILSSLVFLTACEKHQNILFDTPFVKITDSAGQSEMNVDKTMNGILSELQVSISVSGEYFTQPISIEYETIIGNGLTEGKDFKIQSNTKSPLTFDPGTYILPVRILWYKTDGFDPAKDNTLTLKLSGSSLDGMILGLPGPDKKNSTFKFIKQ